MKRPQITQKTMVSTNRPQIIFYGFMPQAADYTDDSAQPKSVKSIRNLRNALAPRSQNL